MPVSFISRAQSLLPDMFRITITEVTKKAGPFLGLPKIFVKLENNYPFIALLRKKVLAKIPNPNKTIVVASESFPA